MNTANGDEQPQPAADDVKWQEVPKPRTLPTPKQINEANRTFWAGDDPNRYQAALAVKDTVLAEQKATRKSVSKTGGILGGESRRGRVVERDRRIHDMHEIEKKSPKEIASAIQGPEIEQLLAVAKSASEAVKEAAKQGQPVDPLLATEKSAKDAAANAMKRANAVDVQQVRKILKRPRP